MKTSNHKVLITGGSRGIGFALAKHFLSFDNTVIITGRSADNLKHASDQLPNVMTEVADMTRLEDLQRLYQKHPDVTVLVNNAGVQFNYGMLNSHEQFDRIQQEIDINFTGLVQLTALYLPSFTQKPESAVVNLSSGLGFVPKQSAPVYCATKSAVHMFTRTLRWQLEDTNTKVFEVIPSLVDTEMTTGRGEGKISPEALVEEFWVGYTKNQYEINIGKVKLLHIINRFLPSVADRIMRHG